MKRARTLAGLALACGVGACSALTSLDGLTSGEVALDAGAGPAASPDGAASGALSGGGQKPPPPPSAAGDSGAGTTPPDGSASGTDATVPVTDSGVGGGGGGGAADANVGGGTDSGTGTGIDAAPGRDAAVPAAYCASLGSAPLFCDDFDEGALATPWDQVSGASGAVTLDGTFFVSPSKSMLSSVNASASAGNIDLAGYKSFPARQGVAGTYTCAFDIRIDAADTSSSSDAVLGAIQLWNGATTWDIEIELAYDTSTGDFAVMLTEDGGGSYVTHPASQHLPYKTWARVAMSIALPAGSGGATPAALTFDGTQVVSATVHVGTSNPIPEIVLGATYATPAPAGWAVRYDNVTFD